MAEIGESILSGRGMSKRFGGLTAVAGVSFDLYKNEILGLIGPNGAGKTTLFNMISGAIPMTDGELYYHGKRIKTPRSHDMCIQGIGRTYQICQPFGSLRVYENVMVGAFARFKKTADAREKAWQVLKYTGLDHRGNALGTTLTLPELKRMEVARALATDPDVLLLDEVIAGLNPTEVDRIVELILHLRDGGTTVLIIEHVMKAIMNLSDRIIVLNQGEKIAEGVPEEIAANELVIESYLGGKKHA